jgi:hypothetical protein
MSNSFYFIALISDRAINLDRGLLFAVDSTNQLSGMKPFHTRYFLTIKQKQSCQSPGNDFGGLGQIKGKAMETYSWFQVGHNLVGSALLCYKNCCSATCNFISFLVPCPF